MDEADRFLTPLGEIDFDFSVDGAWVVARAMADRLHAGREAEVMDFLASCDIELLRSLGRLGGGRAIWHQDGALWLRMAHVTVARHVLLTPPEESSRRRDPAFSCAMRALAERCMGDPEGSRFALDELAGLIPYPGMPTDEAMGLLDWILALRRLNGIADDDTRRRDSASVLACMTGTADLIAAAGVAACFCREALDEYQRRTSALTGPGPGRWLPWRAFFEQHPALFDRYHADLPDAGMIERRWPDAAHAVRQALAATLLGALDGDAAMAAADRLIRRDPALFATLLQEQGKLFSVELGKLIWEQQYPALLPLLFPLTIETRRAIGAHRETVGAMLARQPSLLLSAAPGNLDLLIPLLPTDLLRPLLPDLGTMLAKTTSKAVREAMAAASAQIALDEFQAAGWFEVRNKHLRLACRDILLAHPDQAGATPLLAGMLAAGGFDVAAASSLAAVLAPEEVAPPLADLEAQVAGIARWSAAIKPLDHAEILALFQPLSEQAARATLHLAATADDALPPLASALLAQLPTEKRASLSLHAVQAWIAGDGEPRLRWTLRLLPNGADDRIVEPLATAIMAWGKKARYPRAIVGLDQLTALDSPYALLRIMEVADSTKLKGPLVRAALDALHAAAQRRACTIGELIDDATPDFGLADGAALTAGPHRYRIALHDDLSLRLVDSKGKVSKTLPANKDDSIRDAWNAAASRFAMLAAAVKTSARLQAPRMMSAFIAGKRWNAARWMRLFLEHPLLRIVGRSLIWQAGSGATFRIAEDFTLIQADDAALQLPPAANVTLWHPAGAAPGEAGAWRAHLADYQLTPLIDQTGAAAVLPPAALVNAERLLAPPGLRLAQEDLADVLTRAGYREGQRSGTNGAWVDWYAWHLPMAQLEVRVNSGPCPGAVHFGVPLTVESITVHDTARDNAALPPADWPASLLATVWSHLLLLDAKRPA